MDALLTGPYSQPLSNASELKNPAWENEGVGPGTPSVPADALLPPLC